MQKYNHVRYGSPNWTPNQVQIQRIVSSKAFKTSEVHRNLLNYLADKSLSGEAQNLKEYTVGLDVFGKPATYDPRQESGRPDARRPAAPEADRVLPHRRPGGSESSWTLPKGGSR